MKKIFVLLISMLLMSSLVMPVSALQSGEGNIETNPAVAENNGKNYTDLQLAIDEAVNGDVIKLFDQTIDKTIVIAEDKEITLQLEGSINVKGDLAEAAILNKGNLTIKSSYHQSYQGFFTKNPGSDFRDSHHIIENLGVLNMIYGTYMNSGSIYVDETTTKDYGAPIIINGDGVKPATLNMVAVMTQGDTYSHIVNNKNAKISITDKIGDIAFNSFYSVIRNDVGYGVENYGEAYISTSNYRASIFNDDANGAITKCNIGRYVDVNVAKYLDKDMYVRYTGQVTSEHDGKGDDFVVYTKGYIVNFARAYVEYEGHIIYLDDEKLASYVANNNDAKAIMLEIDYTKLKEAIAKSESADRTKYSEDLLVLLDEYTKNAKEVLANDKTIQFEVNVANRKLREILYLGKDLPFFDYEAKPYWISNSEKDFTITLNVEVLKDYSTYAIKQYKQTLLIDNKALDFNQFEFDQINNTITIKKDYLKQLSIGNHELAITYVNQNDENDKFEYKGIFEIIEKEPVIEEKDPVVEQTENNNKPQITIPDTGVIHNNYLLPTITLGAGVLLVSILKKKYL